MIDWTQLTNFLVSGVSLTALLFTLLFLVSDYRLDDYRQKLFLLRDELFDLALDRQIDFAHPAYRFLNLRINSLIRYAHKTKLVSLLINFIGDLISPARSAKTKARSVSGLRNALSGLQCSEQLKLIAMNDKVSAAIVNRVLFLNIHFDSASTYLPNQSGLIAWDAASDLAAAHAHGTVHRDIKPKNILLARAADGRERPKIVDFGLVTAVERQAIEDFRIHDSRVSAPSVLETAAH